MKITNKERKILKKYFGVSDSKYSNGTYLFLEQWTNGGVDMCLEFNYEDNMTIAEELEQYLDNFNIDEEIELYREGKDYREAFTIRESVNDFESWVEYVKSAIEELKKKGGQNYANN